MLPNAGKDRLKNIDSSDHPGRTLRVQREKLGMSLADVGRITKIKESMLTLLEEGQFALLPPPVFVFGFLRAYARVVKLDGNPLVQAYQRSQALPFEPVVVPAAAPSATAPAVVNDPPSRIEEAFGLLGALDKRRVGFALVVLLFILVVTLTLSALLGHNPPAASIS